MQKRSPKRRSQKRRSPKQRSQKRRSPKRRSPKRRSQKRRSPKRRAQKRRSQKRRSPKQSIKSKQKGGNDSEMCSQLQNKDACHECVDDWYLSSKDHIRDVVQNALKLLKERGIIKKIDDELLGAINSSTDPEEKELLISLFSKTREERINSHLKHFKDQLYKLIVEINTDEEFNEKYKKLLGKCDEIKSPTSLKLSKYL